MFRHRRFGKQAKKKIDSKVNDATGAAIGLNLNDLHQVMNNLENC